MASGLERVQQALDACGLDSKVVRLPNSTRTAPEAAQAVGCDVGAIAKSLLFMADGEPVLVICAGDRRVNIVALSGLLGAADVKMAAPDDVRLITGFAIGGVPPIGHVSAVRTVMDTGLLRWPVVYAAAGAPDALFPVNPALLLEVSGATPADIGA